MRMKFRIKAVACTMRWIVQVCPPLQKLRAYGIMSSFRNIIYSSDQDIASRSLSLYPLLWMLISTLVQKVQLIFLREIQEAHSSLVFSSVSLLCFALYHTSFRR